MNRRTERAYATYPWTMMVEVKSTYTTCGAVVCSRWFPTAFAISFVADS